MRTFLVALVALAVTVLVAVVAVPRIIAGEVVQTELRSLVQEAAGSGLSVRGRIGLSVFPRLRITVGRVEIADALALPGAIPLHADRLELDVAPLSLAAGRLEVRRVRAVRPWLALPGTATPAALGSAVLKALALPGLERLASIQILDGRIEEAGGTSGIPPRVLVEDIGGFVRRDALLRRFEATLTASSADAPLDIEAEAGEAAPGKPASLSLDLVHGGGGDHARVQFQGFGTLTASASELKGRLELEAAEAADLWRLLSLLAPTRPLARLPRTAPILLSGEVELTPASLALSGVQAQLGPNTLELSGRIGFGAPLQLELEVGASELAADPVSLEDLRWLLNLPWRGAAVEGRTTIRVGLVRWREQTLQQIRADLRLTPEGVSLDHLSASLPGTADLTLAGMVRPEGGSSRFDGNLTLSAENARGPLAVLGLPAARLPARGLRAVLLSSRFMASRSSMALRDFELRVDGSRLTGSAALVPGVRPRFAVSARADRLDLNLYRPPPALLETGWLRERLTSLDAAVDLTVGRASLGELWAEGLYLRGSLNQGLLRLAQLTVRDLAEARLNLSGTSDLPVESFQLEGSAEITRPGRLLRALGVDPPPTITRFAPVRITGSARGGRDATQLELDMAAAGATGRIDASLGPWLNHRLADATAELRVDRLEELLRNLGLIVGERPALARPAHLTGRIEAMTDDHRLDLRVQAPPSDLVAQLTVGTGKGAPALAGKVESGTLDRDLLQSLVELAPTAFGAAPIREVPDWLGHLPETPLAFGVLRALNLDLELATERLAGFEPEEPAGARLRLAEGLMTIDRLRLPLAGGRLGGVVTLTGTAEAGTLGLDLSLSAARAERVLAGLGIPPGLEGELALGARLAASGRSVAELVGTLEGEGELRLHKGAMPSLLPSYGSSPQRVISLDGRVAATRGALTSEPALGLTLPAAQGEVRARLDLAAWIAELAVALAPTGPEERAKTVTRRFVGPPGRLRPVASEPEPAGRAELARP